MSTPNFLNKNASKIFASNCEEEWDYEDLLLNITSELKEFEEVKRYEDDRSYPGNIFAEFEKQIGRWAITIELVARGGYYGGVNLDWNVYIIDPERDEEVEYEEAPKTVYNYIQSKIRKVEKIYKRYTTPLICRAVFSNGEAVYEKAN